MNNNKLNIEEIKYLIPDYITGLIDSNNKLIVENALNQSPELKEFYNELKGTFDFVGNVKFQEPSQMYWNNLLPRIHQRIEEIAEKKTVRNPLAFLWKILVPVAAVVLIFIIYQVAFTPEKQLAKFGNSVTTEKKIIKDIVPEKKQEDNLNNTIAEDNNNESDDIDNSDNNDNAPKQKRQPREDYYTPNASEETAENMNNANNDTEIKENIFVEKEEIAAVEIEETAITNSTQGTGFDEEIEGQLKKLDDTEQNNLLEQLSNTNL
jgi:hypothetical protein